MLRLRNINNYIAIYPLKGVFHKKFPKSVKGIRSYIYKLNMLIL